MLNYFLENKLAATTAINVLASLFFLIHLIFSLRSKSIRVPNPIRNNWLVIKADERPIAFRVAVGAHVVIVIWTAIAAAFPHLIYGTALQ